MDVILGRPALSISVLALYSLSIIVLPFWVILIFILLRFCVTIKGYNYWKMVALTLKRDLGYLKTYFVTLYFPAKLHQRNNSVVPSIFEENVKKHPDKTCFYFEDETWTFKQISELSNRVAHAFEAAGFKRGDTVALFMHNRPEFVAIWIGLSKIGIVTALVNNNLRDKSLLHALTIVDAKAVIFENTALAEAIESIKGKLDPYILIYGFDTNADTKMTNDGIINMNNLLENFTCGPLLGPHQRCNYSDVLLYIYTSGTTGLPKAAPIKHSRFLFVAYGGFYTGNLKKSDIIYVTLPLYHTSGGMLGIGNALIFGCTVVLRKTFSVSQFWTDCIRYECTAIEYIGEMCRYLLSAPPKLEEKNHKIRLMFGNGLRPQIWEEFLKRFNIKNVLEIYGSTEGNSSIYNNTGQVGAIGAVSLIAPSIFPLALIRVSEETGEPIRNRKGLCIRCEPGESGMFISRIRENNPFSNLPGYTDPEATRKKIVANVFKRGDSYFLSGDILSMDKLGYLYFKDRIGDTFRWKGENVSTTEVEAIISIASQHRDCCVYGVKIPNLEGRAGMAAIVDTEKTLDLNNLAKELKNNLPSYARPIFIRFVNTIDLTGTFKLRKIDYRNEAYNLTKFKDPIYLLDPLSQSYVAFTPFIYDQLINGKIRL